MAGVRIDQRAVAVVDDQRDHRRELEPARASLEKRAVDLLEHDRIVVRVDVLDQRGMDDARNLGGLLPVAGDVGQHDLGEHAHATYREEVNVPTARTGIERPRVTLAADAGQLDGHVALAGAAPDFVAGNIHGA